MNDSIGEASDPSISQPIELAAATTSGVQQRPRVWPTIAAPLLALLAACVLQAGFAVAVAVWLLTSGVGPESIGDEIGNIITSPPGMLLMIIGGPGGFGVVAAWAAWRSRESFKNRLGFFRVKNPVDVYGLTVLGSILPLAASIALATWVAQYTPVDTSFMTFFEEVTPGVGVAFVLLIALVPGFCEEMLFRGYVQQRMIRRWGPTCGILVASLLFGLAHVMPPNIALAFLLGVWLGYMTWRTGSIGPAIACHAFVNGGLNAWRLVVKFGELTDAQVAAGNVFFVSLGSVCFFYACRMLASYERPADNTYGEH